MSNTSSLKVNEAQIEELKSAFSLLDKNGDAKVTNDELQSVLDAIGFNINKCTDNDLKEQLKTIQKDNFCDFPKFLNIMTRLMKDEVSNVEDLQEAFRVFDKNNNGTISAQEFKKSLLSLGSAGDVLTAEEIDEILKEANIDPESESFDYEILCQKLMSK